MTGKIFQQEFEKLIQNEEKQLRRNKQYLSERDSELKELETRIERLDKKKQDLEQKQKKSTLKKENSDQQFNKQALIETNAQLQQIKNDLEKEYDWRLNEEIKSKIGSAQQELSKEKQILIAPSEIQEHTQNSFKSEIVDLDQEINDEQEKLNKLKKIVAEREAINKDLELKIVKLQGERIQYQEKTQYYENLKATIMSDFNLQFQEMEEKRLEIFRLHEQRMQKIEPEIKELSNQSQKASYLAKLPKIDQQNPEMSSLNCQLKELLEKKQEFLQKTNNSRFDSINRTLLILLLMIIIFIIVKAAHKYLIFMKN